MVNLPSNNKHWKKRFVRLKCSSSVKVCMKWRVDNDSLNRMLKVTMVDQESFKKVRE